MKSIGLTFSVLSLMALSGFPVHGQQYKMQTPVPPGVAIPDKVETRLGTLSFFGGFLTRRPSTSYTKISTSSELSRPICSRFPW